VLRESEQGRWLGAAPWFIMTNDSGERMICFVGCVDVTDYLDILARRGFEDEVFSALAGWLVDHAAEFDKVHLCNIPQASPALAYLPALVEGRGFTVTTEQSEVCPVAVLPETFIEYVQGLDSKNRHELRRKVRRAAGVMDWYIVGPQHDLDAEITKFLDLMAASTPSKDEFLAVPHNREFFKQIVPRLARCGWLQLAFMTLGGEAVAAYLNFDYLNRIMVYNSGLNPGEHSNLSPGIVLLSNLIEHAIAQHRSAFDFLRGNEAYKYDMGGRDTAIYDLVITRE
jgi:CelD/BcsL family acetyltransferase involved in cellulose biosynthesis